MPAKADRHTIKRTAHLLLPPGLPACAAATACAFRSTCRYSLTGSARKKRFSARVLHHSTKLSSEVQCKILCAATYISFARYQMVNTLYTRYHYAMREYRNGCELQHTFLVFADKLLCRATHSGSGCTAASTRTAGAWREGTPHDNFAAAQPAASGSSSVIRSFAFSRILHLRGFQNITASRASRLQRFCVT